MDERHITYEQQHDHSPRLLSGLELLSAPRLLSGLSLQEAPWVLENLEAPEGPVGPGDLDDPAKHKQVRSGHLL